MKVTKKIEIIIEYDDENEFDFEDSLDVACSQLKKGYVWGKDGDDERSYFFQVKTEES